MPVRRFWDLSKEWEGTLAVTPVTTNLWLTVLFTLEKPESFSSRSALLPLFYLSFEYTFTRLILFFPKSTNPSVNTSCRFIPACIHRQMLAECAAQEFTNRQLLHSHSTPSRIYAACVVHCSIQLLNACQHSMCK